EDSRIDLRVDSSNDFRRREVRGEVHPDAGDDVDGRQSDGARNPSLRAALRWVLFESRPLQARRDLDFAIRGCARAFGAGILFVRSLRLQQVPRGLRVQYQ